MIFCLLIIGVVWYHTLVFLEIWGLVMQIGGMGPNKVWALSGPAGGWPGFLVRWLCTTCGEGYECCC